MTKLLTRVTKLFGRKEEGATLVEYGLLLALIALVAVLAITNLGSNISSLFTNIAGKIGTGT